MLGFNGMQNDRFMDVSDLFEHRRAFPDGVFKR